MNKQYLGDSVYVEALEWGVVRLTTENGLPGDPSNEIFMEPEVAVAFIAYYNNLMKAVTAEGHPDAPQT